jgi:hypothetical protein
MGAENGGWASPAVERRPQLDGREHPSFTSLGSFAEQITDGLFHDIATHLGYGAG